MIKIYSILKIYAIIFILLLLSVIVFSQETRQLAVGKPDAIADLKTTVGAAFVNAKWYVQPAYIETADFHKPGGSAADPMKLYPTGIGIKTHTLHPQINAADFNKGLVEIKPTDLETREGMGLISAAYSPANVLLHSSVSSLIPAKFQVTCA